MALIINAPMPKGCEWSDNISRTGMGYCQFKDVCKAYRNEVSKQYTINAHPIEYFPSDCPILGEIPDEHGRLVDADKLAEEFDGHGLFIEEKVKKIIDFFPVVVEATE